MNYSIDTSGLIEPYRRHYTPKMAPGFWRIIEKAIADGKIRATELVAHELEQNEKEGKEESLYRWARAQTGLIVPVDSNIQTVVRDILSAHPRLVNPLKTKSGSGADPFVIALARINGWAVISEEKRAPPKDPKARPKIPNVCDAFGIRCINVVQLFEAEGWQL